MNAEQPRYRFTQRRAHHEQFVFQVHNARVLLAQAFVGHRGSSAVSIVAHIAKFTVAAQAVPNQLRQLLPVIGVLCAGVFARQFVQAKSSRLPVFKQGVHQRVRPEPQNALLVFRQWLNRIFHAAPRAPPPVE